MIRLRQLVTVAADLRSTERAITEALDVEVCYRDPGVGHFGLRHGLYTIGDRLLEVVAPKQAGTTAGRFLERRGGDGGYMVIVQVDNLADHRARLATTHIRTVFEADAPGMQGLHLHPADVGGAILSIDQADPPESWAWAGSDFAYHANSSVVADMVGVEIQGDDPDALTASWSVALGVAATVDHTIELNDATIRFVPASDGRGDGLAAIDLRAIDRSRAGETLELSGAQFNLV
ncbi:MAG: hypothetical protein P8I99_04860 [Acidimicrobiales bacterium]|nr:hypothetical protein [Acidimicrobiales bacterium]